MPVARVVRVHQTGGPEVLRIDDVSLAPPGRGEVRVRVAAAGVNFLDTQLRSGLYKRDLPLALGGEGSGTVEEAGAASGFSPGDRVAWTGAQGSNASHANVPAAKLVRLPAGLDFEQAAACFFQGLTAHYLSHSTHALKPGDTCIVQSAAGGVGLLLCRMAKLRGARVIGTVSSAAKADAVRETGADRVVVYTQEDLAAAARAFTDGAGVDVVYDAVGRDTFDMSLAALRPRGLLALYGEASGIVPPIDVRVLSTAGSVYLTRTGLGAYIADPAEYAARIADLTAWIADGTLHQPVTRFPLSHVADAHAAIESRRSIGKILLIPDA